MNHIGHWYLGILNQRNLGMKNEMYLISQAVDVLIKSATHWKTMAENWKHWMMLHLSSTFWNVISTESHQSLGMHWSSQSINWTKKIYWNTMNQSGMNYFKKVRQRVSEFKISRYVYPWRIIFKFKNEVFNRVVCRQVSRSESWIQWKIWVLRSDTNIWLIEDWLRWIMSTVSIFY